MTAMYSVLFWAMTSYSVKNMSFNRHGVAVARLPLERPGSAIPLAKTFTVFGALHRFSHSK